MPHSAPRNWQRADPGAICVSKALRGRSDMTLARGLALQAAALLPAGPALAGRRVFVPEGTAGADAQGAATFLVLFPIVAVLVFAFARLVGWRA